MARGGDTYSSVIAWLKILLPMAALVMLSTLFLLPRSGGPLPEMPFTSGDGTAREQVSEPYYAGVTPRGDALTMTARAARPVENGDEGDVAADDLVARLDLSDGSRITLNSVAALLSEGDSEALLEGGVRIESTTGYVLNTERMRTALDRVEAETLGPVTGYGPAGTLEAGRMQIVPQGDAGDVQLLFTGGVKLVYDPKKE